MRRGREYPWIERWATLVVTVLVGLGGCSSEQKAPAPSGSAVADKSKPFTIQRVLSLPGVGPQGQLYVKPGHWTSLYVEESAESNFRGSQRVQWLATDGSPLTYPPLGYRLRSERAIVLPKGQTRGFEQRLFVPNSGDYVGPPVVGFVPSPLRNASALVRLFDSGGYQVSETRKPVTVLRDHQALVVLLADKPADYGFFADFDPFAAAHQPSANPEDEAHYRLVVAGDEDRPLLPTSAAAWTTTGFVVWDGYDAAKLSPEQRTAFVDWLHWGGTLIVSGPDTLDVDALEPIASWLPATSDESLELDTDALQPLADLALDSKPLATSRPWHGVRLRPTSNARVLLGDERTPLVVERRVGRGRVVATAFRLAQPELVAWPSYPSLFHSQLMRRPSRQWDISMRDPSLAVAFWRSPLRDRDDDVYDSWFDPQYAADVRYLAHDGAVRDQTRRAFDHLPPVGPGLAAVRDDSQVVDAARNMLRAASGIFIPSAGFVLTLIGGYVLVAVPANWLVFRAVRHIEWAWLATPVLAIIFTIVVIRAAELDVGFARSVTEVTIVEIQPGYDRAHVSQFAAMYNSLRTTYVVSSDSADSTTLPMPAVIGKPISGGDRDYTLAVGSGSSLEGLVVDSNSVAFVRSEQMQPLGGTLTAVPLGERRYRLDNQTSFELRDVRLSGDGQASIELLPPKSFVDVTLDDADPAAGNESFRRSDVDINPLWSELQKKEPIESLRLLAWSTATNDELRFDPTPSQRRGKTIVVAHLAYRELPKPASDVNTRAEVEKRIQHPE